ncbi:type I restriction enzyme S subunit [Flavobacterium tiangeerense]|uniref:Type I restriction enzyme S subunit n=1 Tax=Flavobacterium tiangeerense TaxID=459471 RepID=A0ABY3FNU9_9FLAO|nr:restriction endonuclease subunit S [Flavobacterium tiangeerense]TWI03192.1 type I restriction enzyme S subunit [Flavobacterium tiangeerense]
MSFKIVKLLDISKPKQWKNLPSSELTEEGYFVYGANGIIGKYAEYNHEYPTLAITCRGATCGSLHITRPKSYINSNAMALDDLSDNVNIKYLYYALFNRGFKDVITGSAQPQITREGLSKIKISLPPLQDQIRIAEILTQSENLITQRKESISLLDELLKSTFLEMFGDEFKNYSKWNTKLSDVISSIDSGWSPLCDTRPRESEKEWAVLKLSCVSNKKFDPTKNKACYPETVIKKELIPKKGDLLFSRKNTFELVGATAFVFKDYQKLLLPDTIFKISYHPLKISGLYLWHLFNNESFSKQVRSLANGAAGSMPNISMVKLKSLKIPNPPIELQNQFAALVEKVETLKGEYIASVKELENMYGVLSQKAFKGELKRNTEVE